MKEAIEKSVVDAFHEAQDRLLNQSTGSRINTLHVSDFVSPCLRKTWYQKRIKKPIERNVKSILYHGLIVHEHSQLSHFHEVTMCYDIIEDKAYTPQEVANMHWKDTANIITGSLDDLMRVGDEYVIADKKTWNNKGYEKRTPDESYVKQLSIYRVLLEKAYGIDAKWGCLLYLDKAHDLTEKPMAFELDSINDTKRFLIENLSELQGKPDPNPCFLCNGKNREGKIYCPYLDLCNQEGRLDKVDKTIELKV
jgi:hypothetical protein